MNYKPLVMTLINWWIAKLEKGRRYKPLIDMAIDLFAKAAADGGLPDNTARREFVIAYLVKEHGFTESEAVWLVGNAWKVYQRIRAKKAKEDEREAKKRARQEAREAAKAAKDAAKGIAGE